MAPTSRRFVSVTLLLLVITVVGWTYYRSLVPAIHPDHDHGLENLAGGGFLIVEPVAGGRRNLVGRPERVLILHWFELGAGPGELPLLVDYAGSVASDPGIEVMMVAVGTPREKVLEWAQRHGMPTATLFVDREGKTAGLIGVQRVPETLIYDP